MRDDFLRWMSSYFPIWCSNKFNSIQLWFLTGFSRARQKIGIFSIFHPKMYSIEKYRQLVKLPTRSQTRRVKLYSIESQNQVGFCCLICFSFVTAVLEKQIQKECDLRNRTLRPFVTWPPFVSDRNQISSRFTKIALRWSSWPWVVFQGDSPMGEPLAPLLHRWMRERFMFVHPLESGPDTACRQLLENQKSNDCTLLHYQRGLSNNIFETCMTSGASWYFYLRIRFDKHEVPANTCSFQWSNPVCPSQAWIGRSDTNLWTARSTTNP
jgi:hypothetical protein